MSRCSFCGDSTPASTRGWCKSCYARWLRAGKPTGGPPPRKYRRSSIITCSFCRRKDVKHAAHGWCYRCYDRWQEAGRPQDGPPQLTRRAAQAAARREDYAWLRTEQRLSRQQAAERLGVGDNTSWRYEADLKEAAA